MGDPIYFLMAEWTATAPTRFFFLKANHRHKKAQLRVSVTGLLDCLFFLLG
jgi:hypothetical protein